MIVAIDEMKDPTLFDAAVKDYDAWFDTHPHAYQSELAAIRELIPQSGTGMEIGVGTGRFAVPLGIKVGIDPAPRMLEIAERRGIKVINGKGEDLPIANESMDYVLMVTTLCFLDDVEQSFEEIYRVLRAGGVFVVAFIDVASPLGKQYLRRKDDSRFYKGAHFYSADSVKDELRKAGFDRFEVRQTIFRNPDTMKEPDPVRPGSGEGVFVVIRGMKKTGALIG